MRPVLLLCCLFTLISTVYGQNKLVGKPIKPPGKILKSWEEYAYYKRDHLRLSEDFKAYNNIGKPISKGFFLTALATGKYIPLVIRLNNSNVYQLYKIPAGSKDKDDVKGSIALVGEQYSKQFKREGTKVPTFKFTDLNGNMYTPSNTVGKILVIKCWYLACQACRAEIPDLNNMFTDHKDRKDILFISLLFDEAKPIKTFLKTTSFKYTSVANKRLFIEEKLKAETYPTHFIINKKGYIVKMTTEAGELAVALRKEAAKI